MFHPTRGGVRGGRTVSSPPSPLQARPPSLSLPRTGREEACKERFLWGNLSCKLLLLAQKGFTTPRRTGAMSYISPALVLSFLSVVVCSAVCCSLVSLGSAEFKWPYAPLCDVVVCLGCLLGVQSSSGMTSSPTSSGRTSWGTASWRPWGGGRKVGPSEPLKTRRAS